MDEMMILHENNAFDTTIPHSILSELQLYSSFKVENCYQDKHILQKYYVPKKEYEYYENWKMKATSELTHDIENVVLIQNIARRHGIKLPKQTSDHIKIQINLEGVRISGAY